MPAQRLSDMKKWERVPVYADKAKADDPYILVRADDADFWRAFYGARDAEQERLNAEAGKPVPLDGIAHDRLFNTACIGRTFGGFGYLLDYDGCPIDDGRGADGKGELNVDACLKVMEGMDLYDAFVTARVRLKKERDERWGNTRPNPTAATAT